MEETRKFMKGGFQELYPGEERRRKLETPRNYSVRIQIGGPKIVLLTLLDTIA